MNKKEPCRTARQASSSRPHSALFAPTCRRRGWPDRRRPSWVWSSWRACAWSGWRRSRVWRACCPRARRAWWPRRAKCAACRSTAARPQSARTTTTTGSLTMIVSIVCRLDVVDVRGGCWTVRSWPWCECARPSGSASRTRLEFECSWNLTCCVVVSSALYCCLFVLLGCSSRLGHF